MSLNIVNKGRSKIYNVSIDVEGKGLSMYEDYYGGDVLPGGKAEPRHSRFEHHRRQVQRQSSCPLRRQRGRGVHRNRAVSFTVAEQPVVQQPEQNDQIESEPIEQPKKKLSTGAILGGGAAILALGGTGLGIALKKRRGKYEIS